MKLIKIAEAQEMVGMVLTGVEGTLTGIYAPKTGTGKDGKPWTVQNGTLKDETGEIRVSFWDHEEISMLMKGHRVSLQSTDGKHGKNGVKVKENSYNGKTTVELSVTATGKILFPDVQDAPHEELREGPPGISGPDGTLGQNRTMISSKASKASTPPKTTYAFYDPAKLDPTKTAQDRVAQYRALYEICWKEAVAFSIKADCNDEDTRQVATSFFINAVREGLDRGLTVKAEKEIEQEIPY